MTRVKRKRLEITTETHMKITVRNKTDKKIYCGYCDSYVQGYSMQKMLETLSFNEDETFDFLSDKQIHSAVNKEIICGNSLTKYFLTPTKK